MDSIRIGITGATGHVGVNLVKELCKLNRSVRILIHKSTFNFNNEKISEVKGSLLDEESLLEFCKNLDVVIHLAAVISIGQESKKKVHQTNVLGTMNLVQAAKKSKVKRFIHFSTIHALVQEPIDIQMDEGKELATNSKLNYERTKALSEQWVIKQNSPSFNVISLNPTSIIGPEDHQPSLMGEFLIMAYKGKIPGIVPGGYNWVDVRDVVIATINCIEMGKPGNRYILGGSWVSIKEFIDLFFSVSDKNKKLPVIPIWLARIGIPFMGLYSMINGSKPIYTRESLSIIQSGNRKISSDKAKADIGFKSRPLNITLHDTYTWMKQHKFI